MMESRTGPKLAHRACGELAVTVMAQYCPCSPECTCACRVLRPERERERERKKEKKAVYFLVLPLNSRKARAPKEKYPPPRMCVSGAAKVERRLTEKSEIALRWLSALSKT